MGKLSAVTCETAKRDPKRDRLLGDGDGLFLRVRPHGTKTWVIEYEFRVGVQNTPSASTRATGAPGESISDWLRHGSTIADPSPLDCWKLEGDATGGHDPAAEWEARAGARAGSGAAKQAALEAEAAMPTVKEAIESFMAKIMAGKKSAPAIRYRLDRLATIIGDKKIRDVTRQDVIAALETIAEGQNERAHGEAIGRGGIDPSQAALALRQIAGMGSGFMRGRAYPARLRRKPTKRDVTLRLDELAAVWRALDNPEQCKADPVTIAAMKLLILTGQRESEVCEAEWSEFDLAAGLWRIPAERTKTKRAHLGAPCPASVAILEAMKTITGNDRYVLLALRDGQPIYGRSVNNALATLFKGGKLPNVTRCHVHDFRRTLITRLPDLGFEPFLGHKIANHVLSGVFAHYNHNTYEEQRKAALIAWAARLETLAKGTNVIQLHRAA